MTALLKGDELADMNADIIIVATGGMPNTEFFEAGHDLCVSSWDVLTGQVKLSGDILLYDENGAEAGIGTAEFLLDQGQKVHMVTPDRLIGTHIGPTNYPAALKKFYDAGMPMDDRPSIGLATPRKRQGCRAPLV